MSWEDWTHQIIRLMQEYSPFYLEDEAYVISDIMDGAFTICFLHGPQPRFRELTQADKDKFQRTGEHLHHLKDPMTGKPNGYWCRPRKKEVEVLV